jgi:hypothetical protein
VRRLLLVLVVSLAFITGSWRCAIAELMTICVVGRQYVGGPRSDPVFCYECEINISPSTRGRNCKTFGSEREAQIWVNSNCCGGAVFPR